MIKQQVRQHEAQTLSQATLSLSLKIVLFIEKNP